MSRSAAQNCAAGAENSKPPKTCRWKVFWGRKSYVNFVTIVAWGKLATSRVVVTCGALVSPGFCLGGAAEMTNETLIR